MIPERDGPSRASTAQRLALIGGSGFSHFPGLGAPAVESVRTPYGDVEIAFGEFANRTLGFLPRHGKDNKGLPHQINHRANIWALKEWGATRVLSNTTVGSLNPRMRIGDVIILDQFIDFLRRGPITFELGHVDMTRPYCDELRRVCLRTAKTHRIRVHPRGLYICCDGPRYETAAEIRAFRRWGADVVGMTHAPEAVLCREVGICYAAVALVVNAAAGLSKGRMTYGDHRRVFEMHLAKVREFIAAVLPEIPQRLRCQCAAAKAARE